jgi:hypothetical protein
MNLQKNNDDDIHRMKQELLEMVPGLWPPVAMM